jgi:hypothetical protein
MLDNVGLTVVCVEVIVLAVEGCRKGGVECCEREERDYVEREGKREEATER